MFAILQKYDFPSKSQLIFLIVFCIVVVCDTAKVRFSKQITTRSRTDKDIFGCLRYCKSTIFQANHNSNNNLLLTDVLFAILQKYDFPSKSQLTPYIIRKTKAVCDTAKVRFSKQITTSRYNSTLVDMLFVTLQKYDFPSKSQHYAAQSNLALAVCDTAKVRFFKQITTMLQELFGYQKLFAILQKYDFSSKSQHVTFLPARMVSCLRYCKSTIFQANHNYIF